MRAVAIALCVAFATVAEPAAARSGRSTEELLAEVAEARPTKRDLRALDHLENAHGQLEEWFALLAGRLDAGLPPQSGDPALGERAELQLERIRASYAPLAEAPGLAELLRRLATLHGERRKLLRERASGGGGDTPQSDELSGEARSLVESLRAWRRGR